MFNILQDYSNFLRYVICQEKFRTEWNCTDVTSLCLPIIDKLNGALGNDMTTPDIYTCYAENSGSTLIGSNLATYILCLFMLLVTS